MGVEPVGQVVRGAEYVVTVRQLRGAASRNALVLADRDAVLPCRWVVEGRFGRLVRNRRPARDYERLTAISEAMIKVAMIRLMLVRLAGQPSRWSRESRRRTARPKTLEDLIAA